MFESSNRRQFQRGLDADKHRALRRDSELSLRKKQREAHLQKRRRTITNNNNRNTSSITNNNNNTTLGREGGGEREQELPNPKRSDIPKYVSFIMQTDNISKQLQGANAIRRLLSMERDPPTREIVNTGIIPKIIQFMYNKNHNHNHNNNNNQNGRIIQELQFESAWIITNIAASKTEFVHYICQHGAIEAFVDLFRKSDQNVANQAIWGLGNIAGDGRIFRDKILESGLLNNLKENLFDLPVEMQRNSVWTISNIFRIKDRLKVEDIHDIVQILGRLLRESKDEEIIRDCLWTFNYLSNNRNEGIISYLVHQSGIINDCMKLLNQERAKYEIALNQLKSKQKKNNYFNIGIIEGQEGQNNNNNNLVNITKVAMLKMNDHIYRPCLRLIGNILSEPDDLTQIVLNAGYLDVIEPWANHFAPTQRKEIMWSFSNILAGSHQQIESIISRPKLLKSIMDSGMYGTLAVKREATWCICNAIADAITSQKKKLAEHGALEVLATMLDPENRISEDQLIVILEGLDGFLSLHGGAGTFNPYADQFEELRGLDHLETRQGDENLSEGVFNAIIDLMRKYWNEGVEEITNGEEYLLKDKLNANIDTNTNQFTFGFNNNNNISNNNNMANMNRNSSNNDNNNNGGNYQF